MIQAADVGVGLRGKEGLQAARASDYVLNRFRHLVRLVLVLSLHFVVSVWSLAYTTRFEYPSLCVLGAWTFVRGPLSAHLSIFLLQVLPLLLSSTLLQPLHLS